MLYLRSILLLEGTNNNPEQKDFPFNREKYILHIIC